MSVSGVYRSVLQVNLVVNTMSLTPGQVSSGCLDALPQVSVSTSQKVKDSETTTMPPLTDKSEALGAVVPLSTFGFLLGAQVATNVTLVLLIMLAVGFAMAVGLIGNSDAMESGNSCERGVVKPANGNGLKMKLRDFMVNSLPRVRSRKKQKQQLLLQQQQQQQQQQANRRRLLNNGDVDENRNTYASPEIEFSEKDESHYRETSPFRHVSSESIRSELEELKIEKSRFAENVNSVNLNVITNSSSDNKCLCFKRLTNSYGPNDVILGVGLGHCTDEDGLFTFDHLKQTYSFNTVPKARSKIRTNPWCNPSPKSTPTGSPTSSPSPNSSSSNSPSLSPTESRQLRSCDSPAVSEMSTESYSTGSASGNENLTISTCSFQDKSNVENVNFVAPQKDISSAGLIGVENDFNSSQLDRRALPTDVTSFNIKNAQKSDAERGDAVNSVSKTPAGDPLGDCVSFQYEEVLESLLEDDKAKHGSFASIQDLYMDDEEVLGDSYSDCSLGSAGSISLGHHSPLFSDSDLGKSVPEDSILGRKSPLCYSVNADYSAMNFHGHSEDDDDDEGEFSFFRSGDCLSDSASSANGDALSLQSCGRSDPSPDSGFCVRQPSVQSSGRSLGDVKASLEEKVIRLREEKLLVEEKIREAQEEDRIRVREKIRFQKQLTLHRKQILLKTLQELKNKLEQQGTRLQESYSAILNVQRRFSQRSSGLHLLPTKGLSMDTASD